MQLFRLILVIGATLAVLARYLQETHRLSVIKRLPGDKARAYYERTRENSEKFLTVLAVVLAVLAVAAATYTFVLEALMLGTVLVIMIVIAVGTRASDAVAVRQQEVILRNLPEKDAVAYYEVLRKRVRKTNLLRAIALSALVVLFYCYKHRLGTAAKAPPPVVQPR